MYCTYCCSVQRGGFSTLHTLPSSLYSIQYLLHFSQHTLYSSLYPPPVLFNIHTALLSTHPHHLYLLHSTLYTALFPIPTAYSSLYPLTSSLYPLPSSHYTLPLLSLHPYPPPTGQYTLYPTPFYSLHSAHLKIYTPPHPTLIQKHTKTHPSQHTLHQFTLRTLQYMHPFSRRAHSLQLLTNQRQEHILHLPPSLHPHTHNVTKGRQTMCVEDKKVARTIQRSLPATSPPSTLLENLTDDAIA